MKKLILSAGILTSTLFACNNKNQAHLDAQKACELQSKWENMEKEAENTNDSEKARSLEKDMMEASKTIRELRGKYEGDPEALEAFDKVLGECSPK